MTAIGWDQLPAEGGQAGYWRDRALAAEQRLSEASTPSGEVFEKVAGEEQLIAERDAAEDALSAAFSIVTGRPVEWSNLFGFREALDEIRETIAALHASPPTDELVGSIEAATVDLDLLRIAIESDDPKAELLIRVTGTWKHLNAALSKHRGAGE